MKATLFLRPLEYSVEVIGERWHQGDQINGVLKVRNHGNEKIERSILKIILSSGNYKKLKAKDSKGWENLLEIELASNLVIGANSELEYQFAFQLPESSRITDKDGSLYLAYKDSNDDWPIGNIELVIDPKIIMKQFLEIFENFVRFKVVQIKFVKGMVEVKLNPPTSRDFAHIDSLVLRLSDVGNNLNCEYLFNTRVLEMLGGAMVSEKKTKKILRNISQKEFYMYGNSPNQEFVIESINSAIREVKSKMQF